MENKRKILIVDDEAVIRQVLGTLLSIKGFSVIEAVDGKEAVESVEREHPDLVLMDLMMPNLDGFGACQTIRKDSANALMPILIVTAKDKDSDIVHALGSGADDYSLKPIDGKELLEKIENLFALKTQGILPSQMYEKKRQKRQLP